MNFVIIGCGIIAFTHAMALKEIEECDLYGVCDIIPEKADEFAKTHNVNKVYYDYEYVLKDPNVEVVCICVPSGIHGEIAIAAAKAGKAIVCEKPMEITVDKIREVIGVVEETGVKMQCIFQRRMMPVAIAVKRAIEDGKFGDIVMASADLKYYRDQAYYDSAGWRGTWELDGGGALMNQGVHGVDLILWMVGDKVDYLYGEAETLARNIPVEDTAAAILKLKKGALCVIQSATTTFPGFSTTFAIHGTKGTVIFNDEGIVDWIFLEPKDAPARPDIGTEIVGGSKNPVQIGNLGHKLLLKDIVGAVRNNRETLIPPQDAVDAVQVICGIYESTKTGKPICFK
jgi:predicted dehydrogenase